MLRRFLVLLILLLVGIAGCFPRSSAGPFVTDISYDGEGNLIVTKNMIILERGFDGVTLSNGDNPQTVVIKTAKKEPPIR